MEKPHYTMVIQWSNEDRAYLVSLPEWRGRLFTGIVTHGETYEEAVRNGQEALELLIEVARVKGEPLPEPRVFAGV